MQLSNSGAAAIASAIPPKKQVARKPNTVGQSHIEPEKRNSKEERNLGK